MKKQSVSKWKWHSFNLKKSVLGSNVTGNTVYISAYLCVHTELLHAQMQNQANMYILKDVPVV